MLTVYLTRHGETQWNTEGRLQGWKNSPLTNIGIKNAQLLGKRLSDVDFSMIYTSPSERAIQTAEYIRSGRDIPTLMDEDLKEISYGEWEGKTKEEIKKEYKEESFHFWNAPHKYDPRPHNGEGFYDFKQRVEGALKRILKRHASGNILIVTHAATVNAILSYVKDTPIEKMWEPPFIYGTSLSVFHWDGKGFNVEMIGDMSHFEKDV